MLNSGPILGTPNVVTPYGLKVPNRIRTEQAWRTKRTPNQSDDSKDSKPQPYEFTRINRKPGLKLDEISDISRQ